MPNNDQDVINWISEPKNISDQLKHNGIEIDHFLAKGGQGIVYQGQFGGGNAAIKIYFPGQIEQRIGREVNALAILKCPSIVRLLWNGNINAPGIDLPLVVTEFVAGQCLTEQINIKPLNEQELGIVAYDVAQAIQAMWNLRIVHRDIKPSNIILRPNGRACVIDLGLARHLDESSLTAFGYTWGTRGYFSPEQYKCQKQLTCKSDVYALGVVLLECALGRHPSNRNQDLLLARDYYRLLPSPIELLSLAPLIKSMLDPRANIRPKPIDIMNTLIQFKP